MSTNKTSINGIQYLRAYAAILVVLNHFRNTDSLFSKTLGLDKIGGFGVDIFFIISGFIMAYTLNEFSHTTNKSESISFIKRRILRIYPIYLIILIPIILFYFVKVFFKVTSASFYSVIGSILLIPDITNDSNYHMLLTPAWTLVYEMFFYLSLALVISLSGSKRICIITYSTILILTILIVNFFDLQGARLGWVSFWYMIGDPIFLDFVLGFLLYKIQSTGFNINIPMFIMFPLLIVITIIAVYLEKMGLARIVCFGLTSFVIVSIFTLSNAMKKSNNKQLLFLGAASYSIYIIHPLLFPLHKIFRDHFVEIAKNEVSDLLFAITAIVLGCFFYRYIEIKINNIIKSKLFIKSN